MGCKSSTPKRRQCDNINREETQKRREKHQNIFVHMDMSLIQLFVHGYIRQKFERKYFIHDIITIIIRHIKHEGARRGDLYVCGSGSFGKLGVSRFYDRYVTRPVLVQHGNEIIDIAACNEHTMMIDVNGRVWVFGCGQYGQLGTGNMQNVKVRQQIHLKHKAIAVCVGYVYSLILVETGSVLSCGDNEQGQLGHGDTVTQSVPKVIEALEKDKITQISSGSAHSAALSEDGNVFMWGYNQFGQCGVGKDKGDKIYTPTMIQLKEKVSVIECGYNHSLLITIEHLLFTFGYNGSGRLGIGSTANKNVPTFVETFYPITKVCGGGFHSLCVDDAFNVWAFGNNERGQCAHPRVTEAFGPDIIEHTTPKKIEYFAANNIKAKELAAGAYSSCVISQNGECFMFGDNNKYQLGLKCITNYFHPTKLPLLVCKASMGEDHSTFIGDQTEE